MHIFYSLILLITLLTTTLWAMEDDGIIQPKTIQLNMMWLNASMNNDQESLFPNDKANNLTQHIVDAVSNNKDIFPINLWYSSKVTSPEQIAVTQSNVLAKGIEENAITYRDMWDMRYVQEHESAFDHSIHPPYFISDLARVAVLLDDGTHASIKVYQDINFPTHSLSTMMDDMSAHGLGNLLKTYGFALAKNKGGDMNFAYENSFTALDTQNAFARHALDFAVLQINTLRANHFAENDLWKTWNNKEVHNKTQIVFSSFKPMFSYYHYLRGDYGINDDQKNMPQTFEGRVENYKNPQSFFDLMNGGSSKVTYKQGKDKEDKDYVGYQRAGKTFNGLPVDNDGYISVIKRIVTLPSLSSGWMYTLSFGKEQSSFYTNVF